MLGMTIFFNLPRHERTPETEIDLILSNLSLFYDELYPGRNKHEFINVWFKKFYEDESIDGDVLVKDQNDIMEMKYGDSVPGASKFSEIGSMLISCAYCCQSLKAWYEGKLNESWTFVVDARFWSDLILQRAKRLETQKKLDHDKSVSESRSLIVKENKQKIYYERQLKFVGDMYNSRAWKNKELAVSEISKALEDKIEKEGWPVEKVKCKETGKSMLKEDWQGWVKRKLPSAKQIKIDAKKFTKNR
jgi:hypothetical protein